MGRHALNVLSGAVHALLLCSIVDYGAAVAAVQDQQVPMNYDNDQVPSDDDALHQQLTFVSSLIKVAKVRGSVNEVCLEELELIEENFLAKRPWAVKVIDAMGGRLPGFLLGQNFWLGSRETCNAVTQPIHLTMSSDRFERPGMEYGILNETAPFDVHFKVANLEIRTPWQVDWRLFGPEKTIVWGLCLPVSCSNDEVAEVMEIYLESDLFSERSLFGINATLAYVKDVDFHMEFFQLTSVLILLGILGFSSIMIILAMCLRSRRSDDEGGEGKENDAPSPIRAFIQCYDARENVAKVFRMSDASAEIRIFSAIRTIFAYLIIPFHFVFFALNASINRTKIISYLSKPLMCLSYVAVEPFFIMSGFLLTYSCLRNRKLIKDAKLKHLPRLFLKYLFHRWIRLAPPYYAVVVLDAVLHALLHEISVHTPPTREDEVLKDGWWKHILFVNNFMSFQDSTLKWTWSIACDMQFFIIGTVILFIYIRRPTWGKIAFAGVALWSVLTYYINGTATNFNWQYDVAFNSTEEMYLHPMMRILSYLVGMLAAWYVVERPQWNPTLEWGFGHLSFVVFVALLFPTTDIRNVGGSIMPTMELLMIRLFASFWVSWVLVAGVKGQRTWFSPVLQSSIYQPIARLSYSIYLVHPIIIMLVINLTDSGFPMEWPTDIIGSAGTILLSTVAALIFSALFEMPYCQISSLLAKQKR